MPGDISKLAAEILIDPVKVEVAPQGRTIDKIDQRVYFVPAAAKRALLIHLLTTRRSSASSSSPAPSAAPTASPRRWRSRRAADAIHGNKSQNARQKALENFRRGRARVLVATDIASRGIDVTASPTSSTTSCRPSRELRPPHRPHRARRRLGRRPVVLRRQRARPAQEHRAPDQPAHRRGPTPANEECRRLRRSVPRPNATSATKASVVSIAATVTLPGTPMATATETVVAAAAAIARSARLARRSAGGPRRASVVARRLS